MEKVEASKYCSLHRRNAGSLAICVRVDAKRRLDGVPRQKSERGSHRSSEFTSCNRCCISADYPQASGRGRRPRLSSCETHRTRRSERSKHPSDLPSAALTSFYQSNILVSRRGRARLMDFGFTSVVRGLNSVLVPESQGCTLRWAAPEVIRGEGGSTQEADIYSFGMVVTEVGPLTCS